MLRLFGSIYGAVVTARNAFYDKGVFETVDLGGRTVSVGNITTGGTGKTPLVAFVARVLAERGERVCILTRGYGRKDADRRVLVSDLESVLVDAETGGDEPVELAHKLLGKAIIVASADRAEAAAWAKRRFPITAFVLDDGFQHRRAGRDVDIVCVDATSPFRAGKMLPAGRLREPVGNIKRADIVVITRSDLVADISTLRASIAGLAPSAAMFEARNELKGFRELNDQSTAGTEKLGQTIAFCGLGNPASFFELLHRHGVTAAHEEAFRDHHRYTQADIGLLQAQAEAIGAETFVTTAKDAVKLTGLTFKLPCYVAEIEVRLDDADAFSAML